MSLDKKKQIKKIISICIIAFICSSFLVHAPAITFTEHTITSSLPGVINVAVGDIDLDGYQDIVAVGRDPTSGYIAWYKNNSDYTGWTEYIIYNVGGNRMVRLDDCDQDGDLDVFVSNYPNDRIDVFECPSDPTSTWTRHAVTTTDVDPGYIFWVDDFNEDGYPDVYGSSPYGNKLRWFRNDGSFSFTSFIVGSPSGARGCAKGDFDGDGDMDVAGAMGGSPYTIYWFENDISGGTTSNWGSTTITSGVLSEPTGQYAMDVDGDGDMDLVAKSLANTDLYWFENINNGSSWDAHQITSNLLGSTYQIWGGDVDLDGDNDIGCTNLSGDNAFWLENTNGDGSAWSNRIIKQGMDDTRDILFSEYNVSGVVDVFVCSYGDNTLYWFESNLTAPASSPSTNSSLSINSINGQSNNSYDGDNSKTVTWNKINDTLYYNLQISNNTAFTDLTHNITDINESNYGVDYYEYISENVTYVSFNVSTSVSWGWKYYRVRAYVYE